MIARLDALFSRSRLGTVLAVAALVTGVFSALSLPQAFFPSVARPAISVSCSYPGANAREVMNTIAGPIEDQVNGVEGFDHMSCSCGDTGSYSLTVYFQAGYDRDIALMKVQAAVQQAMTQLPQEVKNTGVTVGIGQTVDLGYVTCYSENGKLTRDEVVDYVFGIVNPAIKRVQGVGASSVQDDKIAMRVWLDADRMAAVGLNTDEVVAAVKSQNVQASLGTVGASPTGEPGRRVISLVAKGRLHTPEEFGAIIVRTKPDGGVVYLRDVADIHLGHESYAHAGLFGDKPACIMHLYQLPGADTLATVARVKRMLTELEPRFPGDLKWDMTVDISRYSLSALQGAVRALVLVLAIALVVLIAIFRSVRVALAPLFTALVVGALVLTVLRMTGCFVTVLTLYALSAALAFAVVVATVGTRAILRGELGAVRLPVVAAGLSIALASFVLLSAGGVQGLVLRELAMTFAAAGGAVVLAVLVVLPALAHLLRLNVPTAFPTDKVRQPTPSAAGGRILALASVLALALAAVYLSGRVAHDLVPSEDLGVVLVDFKTREGTSRPQMVNVVSNAYRKILSVARVEKSCTVFGEAIFSGSGENVGKMYLVLKPWSERGRDEGIMDVIGRIREAVSDIPEADINMLTLPTLPGISTSFTISPQVLSMTDSDPVRLANEAHRLRDLLQRLPAVDAATCGYNTDAPHLRLVVDREKCEMFKVPLATLFSTLQHYLGSIYVNDINLGIQVNRVTLMSDWNGRSTPEAMSELYVRSSTGAMVPVKALVEFKEELGPRDIYRYNRYIYCTVDVTPKAGVSLHEAMTAIGDVFARELPRDYATGWSGIAYEESSGAGNLELTLSLALLAAYLVFVVCGNSWRKALLDGLPSVAAVFGMFFTLWMTGTSFSIYSRFCLVLLVIACVAFSRLVPGDATWRQRAALPLLAALLVLPLLFVTGAGAAGSRSFGLSLMGGYAIYALIGLPIDAMFHADKKKER